MYSMWMAWAVVGGKETKKVKQTSCKHGMKSSHRIENS